MIARLLVAFGASIAASGFTVFGMATSYIKMDDDMAMISYIAMAAGVAATVVGIFWYRADERKAEAAIHARSQQPARRR
jgi:membrane protein DedA with SNARE-associated domain